MPETLKVDRQGRVVIPQHERERLGVRDGGTLELVPTSEGVLLERRRRAEVRVADDGLPVASVEDLQQVSNDETIDTIHRQRERT